MAVSKRTRYEVLRRDGYACRYCGAMAPDVVLTIDHVMPVSLGGSDAPENLVAACKDCNAGKASSNPDAELVADVSDDALRYAKAVQEARQEMISDLRIQSEDEQAFYDSWAGWHNQSGVSVPLSPDWAQSVRQWLQIGLPLEVLEAAIPIAMNSSAPFDAKFRYFAGICRNKAEALKDRAREIFDAEPQPEPLPVVDRPQSEPLPVSLDPYLALAAERLRSAPALIIEAFIDRRPVSERVRWVA